MSQPAAPPDKPPAPIPQPQPEPKAGPPRPTPAQVAKQRADAIDRAVAQACPTPPIFAAPAPRWNLLRMPDGSGELKPPPSLPLSAEEYARFNASADDEERSLVQLIRQQAGALPEADSCRQSARQLDALLAELGRLRDAESSAAASIRHALSSAKLDKLARLTESRNGTARQIEVIERELPALQRGHATLCRDLLQACRAVSLQVVSGARQRVDEGMRGWSRSESLDAILSRVGPACILSGRLFAPAWPDSQATLACESILNGPVPQALPEPPPPAPPALPHYGMGQVQLRARP
jgi:hypothetical protein